MTWPGLRAGQRLLVHAATGGVGMAAVAIGRHLGAEVFATASPGKQHLLAGMGVDGDHVASTRDGGFEAGFLAVTGGAGMDVVLNALAGELTDASLRLLPRGGVFVEMGRTDLRDPAQVAAGHPGVAYRAFELGEAGPGRLGEVLAEVMALLADGVLPVPRVLARDARRAREALRFMSQARHAGKIVLTIPRAPRPGGVVLVTGGTGLLGGLVARHYAAARGAAAVIVASRGGPAAAGAARLAADVAAAGARAVVVACDAGDRDALAGLLGRVRVTAVVHAAGVLDDATVGSLTAGRVEAVMRPKADGAWHLHELAGDVEEFILFSSAAAALGSAGQGNYAAANAFLDGLAAYRQGLGLPAVSLGWGLWAGDGGMGGRAGGGDRARMGRGGVAALAAADGLGLLDLAAGRDEAHLLPARLDLAGIRAQAAGGELPPLWRELAGGRAARRVAAAAARGGGGELRGRLAALGGAERDRVLLDVVRGHAAAVLGHGSADAVAAGRAFRDIGFDSLTAIELRNRLNAVTGLRLPATLVFDYPTPAALAG